MRGDRASLPINYKIPFELTSVDDPSEHQQQQNSDGGLRDEYERLLRLISLSVSYHEEA